MVALLIESWIWWSLVIVVAGSRFLGRRLTLGSFRNFQVDDYLMAVVLGFYTTLIVTINIVRHADSNLLPPDFDIATLTPQEVQMREYGSKLILVVEQCQCVTVWGAKLCLIALYLRLTTLRRENIAIKALGIYVISSFIIMDVLYFAVWCRPFHEYWAVPTNSPQCDAATDHLITNAVFNLTSDCIMLAIGLPMFLRMNLPWQKKIPLVGVFSLGIFVILAAILNKVYSFTDPFGSLWTYWYVRESSTALLVANLPFVWSVWRRAVGIHTIVGRADSLDPMASATSSPRRMSEMQRIEDEFKRAPTMQSYLSGDASNSMTRSLDSTTNPDPSNVTLSDMLNEKNPTIAADGTEPNPYTHPMLFYARKGSSQLSATTDANSEVSVSETHSTKEPPSPRKSSLKFLEHTHSNTSRRSAGESSKSVVESQATRSPPSSDSRKSTRSVV